MKAIDAYLKTVKFSEQKGLQHLFPLIDAVAKEGMFSVPIPVKLNNVEKEILRVLGYELDSNNVIHWKNIS